MLIVHSKRSFDWMKQLDAENRPLLANPNDGELVEVAVVPVMPSDRGPIDNAKASALFGAGATLSAVAVTSSNTPGILLSLIDLDACCTVGVMTFLFAFAPRPEAILDLRMARAGVEVLRPSGRTLPPIVRPRDVHSAKSTHSATAPHPSLGALVSDLHSLERPALDARAAPTNDAKGDHRSYPPDAGCCALAPSAGAGEASATCSSASTRCAERRPGASNKAHDRVCSQNGNMLVSGV